MDGETPSATQNGITLKRTTTGYTWNIAIGTDTNDIVDLDATIDKAITLDARLTEIYGPITVSDGHGRRARG